MTGTRLGRAGGQGGNQTAVLAAEAAPCPFVLRRYGMHRPKPGARRVAATGHAFGELDARLTDVAAGARNQLADLMLGPAAERAGQLVTQHDRLVLAIRTAGPLNQLIELLVAEPERGCDIPGPRAVHDQTVHRTAELSARLLGYPLGVDQPLPGLPGPGQQLLIHTATVARDGSSHDRRSFRPPGPRTGGGDRGREQPTTPCGRPRPPPGLCNS